MLQFNINSQETLVTQVHMHNKVVLVFHEFRVHNTARCYNNLALVIINVNFLIVNSFFTQYGLHLAQKMPNTNIVTP